MRKFNKMYGKRLRTYKKTGFSIWIGDSQEKQVVHAIFDSGNYTEKFEQDLVEAEKSIVISSPNIQQEKIDRLLVLVKERQENGVSVTVITTDPEKVIYGNADMCYELLREMQNVAINVVTKEEVEERFAVIDDELVWHGGMNLLGKEDAWDNLMRMKRNWTNSLKDFTMNCFQIMIAVGAEIAAKCIMEVFRVKIWKEMRNFWI